MRASHIYNTVIQPAWLRAWRSHWCDQSLSCRLSRKRSFSTLNVTGKCNSPKSCSFFLPSTLPLSERIFRCESQLIFGIWTFEKRKIYKELKISRYFSPFCAIKEFGKKSSSFFPGQYLDGWPLKMSECTFFLFYSSVVNEGIFRCEFQWLFGIWTFKEWKIVKELNNSRHFSSFCGIKNLWEKSSTFF